MPEVPGQDDEIIVLPGTETEGDEPVADEELQRALRKVEDATANVGATQTVSAPVGNGVVDFSRVDLSKIDTDEAIARLNAAEQDVDL